jgi:hypothetical protein
MSINNFKPFAIAVGSRVMDQTTWESQDGLVYGFPAGILTKELLNKAIRQPSVIAAAIAQYVVNRTGSDVLDNGDISTLITQMTTAFGSGGGGPGAAAQLLSLRATGFAFVFLDAAATTTASPTITFTADLQNVTGTVTFSAQAYDAAGTALGSVTLGGTSPNATMTATQFVAHAGTRKVIVTATIPGAGGSTLTDLFSVYRADGGSDAIQARLTNEAHTVASLADGTVTSYSGASGVNEVYKGLALLSSVTTPSVSFSLVGYTGFNTTYPAAQAGITINSTTGAYSVTGGMNAVNATVTIRGTLSTGQTIDSIFSLAKSIAGLAGPAGTAPFCAVSASPSQAFITPSDSTIPAPTSITITATTANIPSPTFVWQVDGVTQVGVTTGVFNLASFPSGTTKIVKCTATGSDASTSFDIVSIYSLKSGDNAFNLMMSNENQSVSCDSSGTPKAGAANLTTQCFLIKGSVTLTTGVTWSIAANSGFTGQSVSGTGVLTTTGITTLFASCTVQATYNGQIYQKVFTANKVLDGASGTGIQGLRGSLQGYSASVSPAQYMAGTAWNALSDDFSASTVIWLMLGNSGTPVSNAHLRIGDTVTLKNAAGTAADTRFWSGSSWLPPGTFVSGNVVVGGTISGQTNLNITGFAQIEGYQAIGLTDFINGSTWIVNAAVTGNIQQGAINGNTVIGVCGRTGNTNGAGVYGYSTLTTGGYGVVGRAGIAGVLGMAGPMNGSAGVAGQALLSTPFGQTTYGGSFSGNGANTIALTADSSGGDLAAIFHGPVTMSTGTFSAVNSLMQVANLDIRQGSASGSAAWNLPGAGTKPGSSTAGVFVPMYMNGVLGDVLWWPRN